MFGMSRTIMSVIYNELPYLVFRTSHSGKEQKRRQNVAARQRRNLGHTECKEHCLIVMLALKGGTFERSVSGREACYLTSMCVM